MKELNLNPNKIVAVKNPIKKNIKYSTERETIFDILLTFLFILNLY